MARKHLSVVALILLAACGGRETASEERAAAVNDATVAADSGMAPQAPPAPAAGLGTGACAFITEAEVSAIMKHEMKFGNATEFECGLASASADPTKSVAYQLQAGTASYDAMATSATKQVLQDVGEKAVLTNNMVAAVKKGRTYLGGVFDSAAPDSMGEKSVELARKVTARM